MVCQLILQFWGFVTCFCWYRWKIHCVCGLDTELFFFCDRLHFFQVTTAIISIVDGCIVIPLGIRGFFFGRVSLLLTFSTLNTASLCIWEPLLTHVPAKNQELFWVIYSGQTYSEWGQVICSGTEIYLLYLRG